MVRANKHIQYRAFKREVHRMKQPIKRLILYILSCITIISILLITYKPVPTSEAAAIIAYGEDLISFEIADYPAKALHSSTFSLQAINTPSLLQGADVTIELEMLGMMCGVVTFSATEVSEGLFEGEGVPLMPGVWKATATITTSDDQYTNKTEKIIRQFKVVAATTNLKK